MFPIAMLSMTMWVARRARSQAVRLLGVVACLLALSAPAIGWLVTADRSSRVPGAIEEGRLRGTLRLGVDYVAPAIALSDYETRWPEGFEAKIADELGAALNVRTELVALRPQERASALAAHRVDVLLVPLAERGSLDPRVETVDTGYRTRLMALLRTDTAISSWAALSEHVVCVAEGNASARARAERQGASVRVLRAPAKSLAQTRTGDCDAAIHDEAVLRELVKQPSWEKFSATLPPSDPYRLVFAVNAGDQLSAKTLKAIARDWSWPAWQQKWAAEVAFEVYLEQDAPDCH
jgi:polar amino acid transport system substrate-binding protein